MSETNGRLLSADQILAAKDRPIEKVECPEWGGYVYVRTVSGLERDAFEGEVQGDVSDNVRAKMAVLTCCDADGKRIFDQSHLLKLGLKSCKPLDRIFTVAMRLNGWSSKDIEELAKNSASGPTDDSHSDSPGNVAAGTLTSS